MWRRLAAAFFLMGIVISIGSGRTIDPDKQPPEIARALAAHKKARDKARDDLIKAFVTATDRLTRSSSDAVSRVKMIEILNAERKRFEEEGLIPWSGPMQSQMVRYMKERQDADADLTRAFTTFIDRALKAKDDERASQLRAELDKALDIQVVARWEHGTNRRTNREVIEFYSNGRIGAPDGASRWSVNRGALVMTWPNPDAPQGAWVDVCAVAADGKSYQGRNQKKSIIAGKAVKE